MIWNDELPASLDQGAGVLVFHRLQLSRVQQLAQILADRANQLVEQNEKILDLKTSGGAGAGGGSSWDRAEGGKGDRGDQPQERRGKGERTRGVSRGKLYSLPAA